MSLRWRLALTLALAVGLAVAAATVAAFLSAGRELRDEVDRSLVSRSRVVVMAPIGAIVRQLPGPQLGAGEFAAPLLEFEALIQVVGPGGDIVFTLDPERALPVSERDLTVPPGDFLLRDVEVAGVPFRMITRALPEGDALQFARNTSDIEAVIEGLRTRLALVGVVGVVLAALAGWLLARRLLRPVEALTGAAEHIAVTQQLDTPIPVEGTDEVGRMGRAFNTMLTALDRSRRQQRQLVADASHELRTPLTSMRTNIELLGRAHDLDPAERDRILAEAGEELTELSSLVEELVDLATDPGRSDEPVAPVRLDELAADVADRAQRRTGRRMVVDTEPSTVMGRSSMLERAISNLVDNAVKFSPSDRPIEIRVKEGTVEVADHGPGIPEEERQMVFERFYRATTARSLPGSGLGLAIVAHVVEAHDGALHVTDTAGGGATFGFTLPTGEPTTPSQALQEKAVG